MHFSRRIKTIFCLAAAALGMSMPQAYATDELIEGAKLCTRQLPHYEREYGIPTHLLSAIASTESGRYHEGLGLKIPWPWTINVEGKGYFFSSKQEAIAAVRKLQSRGINSIDVGCMQVNLHHHPDAFGSLDEAFEPQHNVAYAAGFLRGLYQEEGSWKKAAADYHSKTPALGSQYAGIVYDSWYQILEKLRLAKMQVPEESLAAANDRPEPYVRRVDALVEEYHPIQALPEQSGKKVAAYHTPHMNSISVSSNQEKRENGVMVVRPEITEASPSAGTPMTMAQVKSLVDQEPAAGVESSETSAPDAKIIRVNSQSTGSASSRKSGPTFIFND